MKSTGSKGYAPAAEKSVEDENFQRPLDRASESAFKGMVKELAGKVVKND